MARLTYALFNLAVIAPVAILAWRYDVKPQTQWRGLVRALLLVSVPFILWDIWAVSAGHWFFSEHFTAALRVVGMPLEEYAFFITVPFACLYTWGVIQKHVRDKALGVVPFIGVGALGVACLGLAIRYWSLGYSRSAFLAAALLSGILLWQRSLIRRRQFWVFQVVLLGLFVAANSVLTALPVITYGASSIIGLRIGTIPLEDFFFNFALINGAIMAANYRYDAKNRGRRAP